MTARKRDYRVTDRNDVILGHITTWNIHMATVFAEQDYPGWHNIEELPKPRVPGQQRITIDDNINDTLIHGVDPATGMPPADLASILEANPHLRATDFMDT
jgi:hypothetical protein